MQSNSEKDSNKLLIEQQQKESLNELKRLTFKGLISFNTLLFVRETYTRNLEYEFGFLPKKTTSKVINLNPIK